MCQVVWSGHRFRLVWSSRLVCSSDQHSVANFAAFLKTMTDGVAALNKEELAGMKTGALNKRAREVGVSADEMDDAADEDDPRAALIALIVAASPAELLLWKRGLIQVKLPLSIG